MAKDDLAHAENPYIGSSAECPAPQAGTTAALSSPGLISVRSFSYHNPSPTPISRYADTPIPFATSDGSRGIRILMSHGVGSWLSSANIQFPSELLAVAYSQKGEALLEGFNFFKIQNANMMPDCVPLFGLQLADKQQLVSFFKERGLEIG
jgi:hypothetical protein